jgi:hypothetical protein
MSEYRVPNPSYDAGARSDDPNSEQFLTLTKKRKAQKRKRGARGTKSRKVSRKGAAVTMFPLLDKLKIRKNTRG